MATARLFIALYLDADVSKKLASAIRDNGFDAVSAKEVGNAELDDHAQMEYAIAQHRAILTHNSQHFMPLMNEYWRAGKEHYGIIISQQLPLGELLRRVLKLLNTIDAGQVKNSYRDLGEFK
ncbi:MAG: DUF5615 family PIN-like protein [Chloroflexi bacterium]|nr:DUF5615 family PIN-like protein [Chloroflexota bacterium]